MKDDYSLLPSPRTVVPSFPLMYAHWSSQFHIHAHWPILSFTANTNTCTLLMRSLWVIFQGSLLA